MEEERKEMWEKSRKNGKAGLLCYAEGEGRMAVECFGSPAIHVPGPHPVSDRNSALPGRDEEQVALVTWSWFDTNTPRFSRL